MKNLRHILVLLLLCACQMKEEPFDEPAGSGSQPEWLPSGGFEWTKAEDIETRSKFLRNFGVGYSYNAVRGSFCDWNDIRCQIVNRKAIEDYQQLSGEVYYGFTTGTSVTTHTQFNYSNRDYVAAVQINAKVKVDLGLYNGEKRRRQNFIEDGVEESFYYSLDEEIIMADMFISPANVLYYYNYYEDCDNFLTLSFVNAVRHVGESDPADIAVVDSLINIYGTHVITQAWLGGKIRVDLSNYMWRYKDVGQEEEWSVDKFLGSVSESDASHTGSDGYQWLEHARLNITAYGGDQSTLTGLLGEHAPDGTRTFSIDGISQWRHSLFFDPQDERHSNVELVDMRLTPIWEFAEVVDPDAAARIKAAIHQDVAAQQALLGANNFFDTSFPIRYPSARVGYHASTGWKDMVITDKTAAPIVVNVVSGGRYVACVCHETVGGRDLWVCYPIYEGKIKMPCGVGVDGSGKVYSVQWLNGAATVQQIQSDTAGDTFYITGGEIGVTKQEGVTYAPAQWMPYVELSGGIQPDGKYNCDVYQVVRDGADFVLYECDSVPANMVGWDSEGHRKSNYVYIYNPNELKPC